MDDVALVTFAICAGLAAVAWIVHLVRLDAVGRSFPELSSSSYPPLEEDDAPKVTVIVSAKDEEEDIEACVRSILAQDYPHLELLVVDDRSTDGTPAILERLRGELDTLSVLTIDALPSGWGGQNHAISRGVEASEGEWLCFTDADCIFDSNLTLAVAVQDARANDVELLSILPRMEAPSSWEKVYLPICALVHLVRLRIAEVNDPASPAAYANGAFMLIRRRAYEGLGGHASVRGFVGDDVRLAQIAKRDGVAIRVAGNTDLCRTRMYGTIGGAYSGWSRNLWGALQSPAALGGALMMVVGLFVVPWLCLSLSAGLSLALPEWQLVALAWLVPVLITHLGLMRLYSAFSISPAWSLLFWPGAIFVTAIVARATLRAIHGRGMTWHGVHYAQPAPLAERSE